MSHLAARLAQLSDDQRNRLRQRLNLSKSTPPGTTAIDWETEARLDPSITPGNIPVASAAEPRAVLVTGATGFLGTFLVDELLKQTRADIYCLARAASGGEALARLDKNRVRYGLDIAEGTRLVPLLGDLAKPWLGLEENRFKELACGIDAVYHNGALVNFVYPYAGLKPSNVLGTQEVLRFACTGKTKPVHYVSTISVFGDQPSVNPEGFMEDETPPPPATLVGGYAQSKRVAESLIQAAGARGLPVSIYRPAFVTGDSRTGAWNTDDFLSRIVEACLSLGSAPSEKILLDTVPVDYVSRALVYLSGRPEARRKTFHLTNPVTLSSTDLIGWANVRGIPLSRVSFDTWLNQLRATVGASEKHRLFPLLSIF